MTKSQRRDRDSSHTVVDEKWNERSTYLFVSQVVFIGMFEVLHDTGLVAPLVVPHAEEAVEQSETRRDRAGDDDGHKTGRVARGVLWFEQERTHELAFEREKWRSVDYLTNTLVC